MPMQSLELELQRLQDGVQAMGRMVEGAIVESIDALQRRDLMGAEPLITLDHRITKKRFVIEMDCINLIATQQPVDGDLRAITAMLEITNELERMGDYITDIAKIHFRIVKVDELLSDFG